MVMLSAVVGDSVSADPGSQDATVKGPRGLEMPAKLSVLVGIRSEQVGPGTARGQGRVAVAVNPGLETTPWVGRMRRAGGETVR